MLIENCLIIILSIVKLFSDWKGISFFSIAVSGTFNFILYEYYSSVEIEYLTALGFIAFPQTIFRFFEKFLDCQPIGWLWDRIAFGFVGLGLNLCYIRYLKKNEISPPKKSIENQIIEENPISAINN